MSDQKKPQAGEWWFYGETGNRWFCHGDNRDGIPIMEDEAGGVFTYRGVSHTNIHHEPRCTGWDWQPEPEPEWFDLTPFDGHVLRPCVDHSLCSDNSDYWYTGVKWPEGSTIARAKTWPSGWSKFRCLLKDVPPELVADAKEVKSVYGFCPICGAPGVSRERRLNGNDRCSNGHEYPSKDAKASKPSEDPDEWVTQDRVEERKCDQRRFCHVMSGAVGGWFDGQISGKRHGHEYTSGYRLELRCRRRDLPPMPEQPKTETWHEVIVNVTHYGLPICAWTKELKPDDEPTGRTITREVVR